MMTPVRWSRGVHGARYVHSDKIAERVVLFVDGVVVGIAKLGISSLLNPVRRK